MFKSVIYYRAIKLNEEIYDESQYGVDDLYRIKDIKELIDIDFIELIDSGEYCFIEWPEICEHLIRDNFIKLNFKIISESEREIEII